MPAAVTIAKIYQIFWQRIKTKLLRIVIQSITWLEHYPIDGGMTTVKQVLRSISQGNYPPPRIEPAKSRDTKQHICCWKELAKMTTTRVGYRYFSGEKYKTLPFFQICNKHGKRKLNPKKAHTTGLDRCPGYLVYKLNFYFFGRILYETKETRGVTATQTRSLWASLSQLGRKWKGWRTQVLSMFWPCTHQKKEQVNWTDKNQHVSWALKLSRQSYILKFKKAGKIFNHGFTNSSTSSRGYTDHLSGAEPTISRLVYMENLLIT